MPGQETDWSHAQELGRPPDQEGVEVWCSPDQVGTEIRCSHDQVGREEEERRQVVGPLSSRTPAW